MSTNLYKINLKGLRDGKHEFTYRLGDAFFASIEGSFIWGGDVEIKLNLVKRGDLHQVETELTGRVRLSCDRCLDDMEIDVYDGRSFVVKLGTETREESDEMYIISSAEGVFDLHWLLYEDVVLSLPMQRMHDKDECNQAMTSYCHCDGPEQGGEAKQAEEPEVDPRWAALQQLREKATATKDGINK